MIDNIDKSKANEMIDIISLNLDIIIGQKLLKLIKEDEASSADFANAIKWLKEHDFYTTINREEVETISELITRIPDKLINPKKLINNSCLVKEDITDFIKGEINNGK